jgi:hypothetical protein
VPSLKFTIYASYDTMVSKLQVVKDKNGNRRKKISSIIQEARMILKN